MFEGQTINAARGHVHRALDPSSGQADAADLGQLPDAAPPEHEDGQVVSADSGQLSNAVLVALQRLHSQRNDYHSAEKRLILQIKAICRRLCDGDKTAAGEMFKAEKKSPSPRLAPLFNALAAVEKPRKDIEKAVIATVGELPIASWQESVPGLNLLSLGQLVAELVPLLGHMTNADNGQMLAAEQRNEIAGLPPSAENGLARGAERWNETAGQRTLAGRGHDARARMQESRCYKRMGLALVDGERQRRVKDKNLAIEMGYNAKRRALAYVISCNLIMNTHRDQGPYYVMYLREKRKQLERGLTKGHAHNRALRYIAKKLIRHFLAAWNAGANIEEPVVAITGQPQPLNAGAKRSPPVAAKQVEPRRLTRNAGAARHPPEAAKVPTPQQTYAGNAGATRQSPAAAKQPAPQLLKPGTLRPHKARL